MDPRDIEAFDAAAPGREETATATFALGCFWGPDAEFGAREGVVRTRVGYAGGTHANPTYHDLGDHSEAIQVDYDPDVVSFAELVDVAVANHDPRRQPGTRQYQSALFFERDEERATIEARLDEIPVSVETRVELLEGFHLAEAYHQKYNLRSDRALVSAFEDAGYDDADLRESPAAARLNGAVAGKDVPDITRIEQ
ncbi:MAG: peptide-methionine (S)-S-oxide reductase [Haloarculaceae archaeon]